MLLRMVAAPTSQGSMRIVKEPGKRPGDESGAIGGLKVSKKAVSPFSDLHVRLMVARKGSIESRDVTYHQDGSDDDMESTAQCLLAGTGWAWV